MTYQPKNEDPRPTIPPSAIADGPTGSVQDIALSPNADHVWDQIETTYRNINDLINSLPPDERAQLAERFQRLATEEIPKWWASVMSGMTPEQLAEFLENGLTDTGRKITDATFVGMKNMAKTIETKVKDHFTPKPRMTARDDEIVRLHDEEKLDWKEITKRIRSVPEWANSSKGKAVTQRSLVTAYGRRKKATQNK